MRRENAGTAFSIEKVKELCKKQPSASIAENAFQAYKVPFFVHILRAADSKAKEKPAANAAPLLYIRYLFDFAFFFQTPIMTKNATLSAERREKECAFQHLESRAFLSFASRNSPEPDESTLQQGVSFFFEFCPHPETRLQSIGFHELR